MKKRITAAVLLAALVIAMLPATALAYDYAGSTYNDNDFYKMQAFLNLTSDDGVHTNGWQLNPAYDPNDPISWWYVNWAGDSSDKRITQIDFSNRGLAGSVDLSGFTSLTYAGFIYDSITSVDVSGDIALTRLDVRGTDITELDASGLTALDTLLCEYCPSLTDLNASGCTSLTGISAAGSAFGSPVMGKIDTLDISGCTSLESLSIEKNLLTTIDLSGLSSLTELIIGSNSLTVLDLDGCPALETLNVSSNDLSLLDVSDCTSLTSLDCEGNINMISLTIKGALSLESVNCPGCALAELDASGLTNLETLICSVNDIETLDVTGDEALSDLECDSNKLESLSVAGFSNLEILSCSDNNITNIEGLSDAAGLTVLGCANNPIGELDVSGMLDLILLMCDNCGLASLDLSDNTGLMFVSCIGNSLTALDLSKSTGLELLFATDNKLKFIYTVISGTPVNLAANGGGYVELYLSPYESQFYTNAVPMTGETFINWTESDSAVSTAAKYDLTPDTEYDLTANFTKLELTSSVPGGSIYTGGRITITPSLEGGQWEWDEEYLSATFNSPATFTGLKEGSTQVRYFTEEESVTYDITINQSGLPQTGQDFTWVGVLCGTASMLIFAGVIIRRKTRPA